MTSPMNEHNRAPTRISIVLPTYNGMRYLPTAVKNCLNQTGVNIELVIVDDGSQDGTSTYLDSLKDSRIIIIKHHGNRGLPAALNTGFAATTGLYLTWTSNDNFYAPNALAMMAGYLDDNPNVGLVCAPFWEINEAGQVVRLNPLLPVEEIWNHSPVGACFLYRREVYASVGDYDTNARLVEDYDYWLRVSRHYLIAQIKTPLYYYRLHPGSLTSQPGVLFGRERLIAHIKRNKFSWPWHHYWTRLASIDIEEAFACYRDGEYSRVPSLALRGVARDPRWLGNLGVTSITARSILRTLTRNSVHS